MIKLLFLMIMIESLVSEYINFPPLSNKEKGLSEWWILKQSGQTEEAKAFRSCGLSNYMFFAFEQSSSFIGRIQIPSHQQKIKISFFVWTQIFSDKANIHKNANLRSIEVFLNDQLLYEITSISTERIDCGDTYQWIKNKVQLELDYQFESIGLIVKNNLLQEQRNDINQQTLYWGISHFALEFNRCELGYCENVWAYSQRQFFDLGLDYQTIIQKTNRRKSLTYSLQPNYQSKVRLMLIIPEQIENTFQIRVTNQEGLSLWNQRIQSFDNIKERRYLMVPVKFNIDSAHQDLTFIVQTDANQLIGMKDLLIYIRPCQDYCLTCTSSIDCSACKFGYTKDQDHGKCIPNIAQYNKTFALLHESYMNLNLLDPDNKWDVNNVGINWKKQEFTETGLIVFGGNNIFNPKTSITYISKFDSNYENHIFYAEFYIKFSSGDKLPIIVLKNNQILYKSIQQQKQQSQQQKQKQEEQEIQDINKGKNMEMSEVDTYECDFNDTQSTEQIFKNETIIEKICYMEIEIKHEWTTQFNYYKLIVQTKDKSKDSKYFWGVRNIRIIGQFKENISCALVFTQIYYQGNASTICGNIENFDQEQIFANIKSLKVPNGGKLTLYSQNQYEGKSYVFYQDTPIIEDDLVQIYFYYKFFFSKILGHSNKIKHNTLEL